jgi:hypothetical protein
MKKFLIIQSLPFQRLLRSHFDERIINLFLKKSDIVVVSPFAKDSNFLNRYESLNVIHISPPALENFSKVRKGFFILTSWLRVYGFWFRWRKHMPFFWENRHIQFGINGNDIKFSLLNRLLINAFGFIGYSSKSWKFFDKLHGSYTYSFSELINIASNYEQVIFIQSASWGFQDTMLAFWARKKKWKSIFIPYSTDQVASNGWLFCDYDKNCVQGEAENIWIKQLHETPQNKVFKLGSSYLRVIRSLLKKTNTSSVSKAKNHITIIYCGVSPIYFPANEESEVVFKLANNFLENKNFKISVIYRPAVNDVSEIHDLEKLSTLSNLTFQIPAPSSIGIDIYKDDDVRNSLLHLISSLNQADLLIMSSFSSIALEAAVVGLRVFSYLPIDNEIIKKRQLELIFKNTKVYNTLTNIPTAFTFNELKNLIEQSVEQKEFSKNLQKKLLSDWDYPNIDFEEKLFDIVFS